jgi:hypothetical protein
MFLKIYIIKCKFYSLNEKPITAKSGASPDFDGRKSPLFPLRVREGS